MRICLTRFANPRSSPLPLPLQKVPSPHHSSQTILPLQRSRPQTRSPPATQRLRQIRLLPIPPRDLRLLPLLFRSHSLPILQNLLSSSSDSFSSSSVSSPSLSSSSFASSFSDPSSSDSSFSSSFSDSSSVSSTSSDSSASDSTGSFSPVSSAFSSPASDLSSSSPPSSSSPSSDASPYSDDFCFAFLHCFNVSKLGMFTSFGVIIIAFIFFVVLSLFSPRCCSHATIT